LQSTARARRTLETSAGISSLPCPVAPSNQKGCTSPEILTPRRSEIDIQRKLEHPNVIVLLDAFETDSEFCIVTEFAQGELFEILEADGSLPEFEVRATSIPTMSGRVMIAIIIMIIITIIFVMIMMMMMMMMMMVMLISEFFSFLAPMFSLPIFPLKDFSKLPYKHFLQSPLE